MALFPKKYDKRTSLDEYIRYMIAQLEHYASSENKKRIETEKTILSLEKKLKDLEIYCAEMKQFIDSMKEASNEQ